MKRYAIIVAGGKGERMHSDLPKQFINLRGTPLLMHTVIAFYCYDPSIQVILVLPATQIALWNTLCKDNVFGVTHQIVEGGATRFESVKNGLAMITEPSIVAIHDGVRPLVSEKTLDNCFTTAELHGNAIPVIPVVDSLRKVSAKKNKAVDRSEYVAVQTPQVFQSSILLQAYQQAYNPKFTDDATVVESMGISLNLVEGNRENIKITTPPDIKIAETFLWNGIVL